MKHTTMGCVMRLSVMLSVVGIVTDDAVAQEICGLSNVQYNRMHSGGFESGAQAQEAAATELPIKRAAIDAQRRKPIDLGKPMGYAAKIAQGTAPTVAITVPISGASLAGRSFEVRGTFTGPVNTGVTVNGSPALTFGNQWVSLPLRPPVGAFEISVVATTFDALTASATRAISVGDAAPEVELLPKQAANIAPATMGFALRIASGVVVGDVEVDFNGDGNDDYSGPAAAMPETFTYTAPGLYTAKLHTMTVSGPVTSERSVLIADVVVQRQRACAVYGALRVALAANDLEASLNTMVEYKREAMRPFFTALGNNRPVFATRLGIIANGVIGVDNATLTTLRMEGGQPIGYPLTIASDVTGVWRIVAF